MNILINDQKSAFGYLLNKNDHSHGTNIRLEIDQEWQVSKSVTENLNEQSMIIKSKTTVLPYLYDMLLRQ